MNLGIPENVNLSENRASHDSAYNVQAPAIFCFKSNKDLLSQMNISCHLDERHSKIEADSNLLNL